MLAMQGLVTEGIEDVIVSDDGSARRGRVYRLFAIMLIALALAPCIAEAQENDIDQTSGSLNLESCEKVLHNEAINFREGLCAGEIYATMAILGLYGSRTPGLAACIPKSASFSQGVRIVVAYMERHPELLHRPLAGLAIEAFNEAFPCHGSGNLTR